MLLMHAGRKLPIALLLAVGANVCAAHPRVPVLVLRSLSPDSITQTPLEEFTQAALAKKLGQPIELHAEYVQLQRYPEQTDQHEVAALGPLTFVAINTGRLLGVTLPINSNGRRRNDKGGVALAADVIYRIPQKGRTDSITVQTAVPQHGTADDWRHIDRWDIRENLLSPGTLVEFKPAPIGDRYKLALLGLTVAITLESLLIAALLIQRLREKRMAVALVESHDAVRDLAGRLVSVQENERKRMARELHDDISQQIASIGISISSLKRKTGGLPPIVCGSVDQLQDNLVSLASAVRQLSSELHPHALETLGIGPAMARHAEEFSRRTDIRIQFVDNIERHAVPPGIALCLYRVVQEAFRNIERHSEAGEVKLRLDYFAGGFHMTIKDNGKGFEVGGLPGSDGLGLTSMEERVHLVNGEFCLTSAPGGGTLIEVRVPDSVCNAIPENTGMDVSAGCAYW